MLWVRIDNRLIHGQVIEAWLPYLEIRNLIVVNDDLADDSLQQQILSMAVPQRVKAEFIKIKQAFDIYNQKLEEKLSALFLLKDCQDAKHFVNLGLSIGLINIGNLHFSKGKTQIANHVAVSSEDMDILNYLKSKKIELDFRCIPNDRPEVKKWCQ